MKKNVSENPAVKQGYEEMIEQFAKGLSENILKKESGLEERFSFLDSDVQDILISIGRRTMELVGSKLEEEAKKKSPTKG